MILDLWGVSFHAAVVFGLLRDFLFKSTLGHYGWASSALESNIINVAIIMKL